MEELELENSQLPQLSLGLHKNRKDLDRFVKFFLIKSVQVIVQSRVNNFKVRTECRLPEGEKQGQSLPADWFNLSIPDEESILKPTQKILQSNSFQIVIYLQSTSTPSDRLTLEIWSLNIKNDQTEEISDTNNTRLIYNVYNRMSLLLKSLISVSRVTPAYKIARRQFGVEEDLKEWGILWEVQEGNALEEDISKLLGDKYKFSHVGKVHLPPVTVTGCENPSNSISISLYYRTKMELNFTSSEQIMTGNRMFIKSDHYGNNFDAEKIERIHSVKPAFYESSSFGQNEPDEDENYGVPFGKLCSKNGRKNATVENTNNDEAEFFVVEDPQMAPRVTPQKTLTSPTLPFVTPTNSGSTENSDLLNLFEEFRIAPNTLGSFTENKPESNLENFEHDIILYDDFVKKLCN